MPLKGYTSRCKDRATIITSKDPGNPQTHTANNPRGDQVTQYKIDGIVITQGNRCDYLVMNEDNNTAYLIELKGSDLSHAAKQLESTENKLKSELSKYDKFYRIVANKCKTQEIQSTEFRKYRFKWGKKLRYGSGILSDNINE